MANSDVLVRMKADTKNYDANIAKASRTLEQFKKDNLSLGGVMKQSTAALTSMAASVVSVAAAIGAAKKVMGDMVRINKQFEQSTANLASIMGSTTQQIEALTNQAKQLGATTRYTAVQITELQTNLARLGFTQQEILNSTTAVQAFATATGADLGEAANLAGAALRGFGLNATEMERVASVLSVSTTKSALSFEKLATAVPIVAPVAKQFGFTIEDTVTLLAKLSDAGMDASTAATATRNIFLKMANDSGKLAQALGRPVHSVEEFGEALKEMKEKGMSLNDILSMVGVRSTAAFAVFADNAETLKDFKESITDCGDAMHDMENKQLNTLQGSVTILNSAWEGLMLTFSESNGVIKKVVDSLSELLQAWTRWRNRNKGGDAAIQTYELGGSPEQAQEYIDKRRKEGVKDEGIKAQAEADKTAITAEIDELKKLEKLYDEYDKFMDKFDYHNKSQQKKNEDYQATFKAAGYSGSKESRTQLQKDIAAKIDNVSTLDLVIGQFTKPTTTTTGTGTGTAGNGGNSNIATLRARYEAEEKENIAHLDRMNMSESDYEAKVYEIRKTTLERIAKLYDEDSKEYAQVRARMAQLDIQYQGTQMRMTNKKSYTTETGPSGYSQEGINALRSEIQGGMKSMQIGSSEYMVEANRLVDLASFENLLKTAVQNGIEIDPSILEATFENIDLGIDISDEEWENFVSMINEKLADLGIEPIKLEVDTGSIKQAGKDIKGTINHVQGAAQAFDALGDAMNSIEDPRAKVGGMIAQAIASVAAGYGAANAQAAAQGPWAWIAFAITGLATMITTIAGIKQATAGNYASGGIVGGNSYSGDNMRGVLPNGDLIGLNSGEVVLNAAQQNTLASNLKGSGAQTVHVTGMIKGSDLYLVEANYAKEQGALIDAGSSGYALRIV